MQLVLVYMIEIIFCNLFISSCRKQALPATELPTFPTTKTRPLQVLVGDAFNYQGVVDEGEVIEFLNREVIQLGQISRYIHYIKVCVTIAG